MPDREGVSEAGKSARVFLALWPDEPVREALDREGKRLGKLLGGRKTRKETLHLTLVFIGNLPRSRLPELMEVVSRVTAPSFEMCLDQAQCWRHNRIAFMTTSRPPPLLLTLVSALEAGLDAAGIPFDRRPFKPHVTLLRKADCRREDGIAGGAPARSAGLEPVMAEALPRDPAFRPIVWPVRDFLLVVPSRVIIYPEGVILCSWHGKSS